MMNIHFFALFLLKSLHILKKSITFAAKLLNAYTMAYFDKYGVEFSDDRKILVKCPKDIHGGYVVPEYVQVIQNNAFEDCKDLLNIAFPDSIIYIGNEAFLNCFNLNNVYFGKNIESIGKRAFANCTAITSLTIPNTTQDIHEFFLEIQESAFENCTSLQELHLAKTVEEVKENAFRGCLSLNHIILSRNYFYIEPSAFIGCASVKKLSFIMDNKENEEDMLCRIFSKEQARKKHRHVDTLDILHDFAWIEELRNVEEIYVAPENIDLEAQGVMLLTRYFIRSKSRYHSVVKCFPSAKCIVIPSEVEKISAGAFRFCDKLESISWESERQNCLKFVVEREAFRGCTALKEIRIPAAYKIQVEDFIFKGCCSLEKVIIPFELPPLEPHSFEECINLREIYIDSYVRPNLSKLKASLSPQVIINDSKCFWTEYEEQVIMWYVNWACDRNKDNYQDEDISRMSSFVAAQLKVGSSYYLNNGSWIDAPECEQHLRFMEDDKKEALFKLFVSAATEDNLNAYWLIVFTSTAAFDDIKKLIDSGQSNLPQDVVAGYKTVISKRSKRGINVNHLFFAMTEEEKKQLYDIFK